MIFSWPKTFDDAIEPLVYLNCFAGVIFFRQSNQSDVSYFFMKLYAIIIILGSWMAFYIGLSMLSQTTDTYDDSPMASNMFKLLSYTNSCITVFTPFLLWCRRKGLTDRLKQILTFDDAYRSIFGDWNDYRKEYIRLSCQVIVVVSVVFMLTFYDTRESMKFIRSLLTIFGLSITLHLPILVILVLDLNFCTFMRYLEKKFRDLNNALLGLSETSNSGSRNIQRLFVMSENNPIKIMQGNRNDNTKAEDLINHKNYSIREIRRAHLELCKLSRGINSDFGIQNLLSLGISFVMITGLLYSIYSNSLWNSSTTSYRYTNMIQGGIWCSIYIFKIFMINHSCWSVSNEARTTGEVLHELLNREKLDKQFKKDQIQEFALQMLQNPVSFDACGFFTLDYTFVQGVIGSITTYLVILIQISNVSERSIVVSNPPSNDTT